jgi:biotin carboxyl carrier protein
VDGPEKLANVKVARIGPGAYRIEHQGRGHLVYVAGAAPNRWIFWAGRVFREPFGDPSPVQVQYGHPSPVHATSLTAPMPARVGRILVEAGTSVRKGDTLLVLEAMKMELPLRAPDDATITAVLCREGELVAADTVLVELS